MATTEAGLLHAFCNARLTVLLVASLVVTSMVFFRGVFTHDVSSSSTTLENGPTYNNNLRLFSNKERSTAIKPGNAEQYDLAASDGVQPILYAHFHKSGGSTMCETMKKYSQVPLVEDVTGQKLKTHNCNAPYMCPQCPWTEYQSLQSCATLQSMVTSKDGQETFMMVEIPMIDTMPCAGFRTMAVMRDPVARLISHMGFEKIAEETVWQWMEEHTPNPADDYLNGYSVVNSMVIRQLLGRERFLDTTPIQEDDFLAAKALVDKFDAFVLLEHMQDPAVQSVLEQTVPEFLQAWRRGGKKQHKKEAKHPLEVSDAFIEHATVENKYDTMLYQYVMEKLGLQEEGP